MDPKKNPPPVRAITAEINNKNFDFVTEQENEHLLTNPIYQLNPKYALADTLQGTLTKAANWNNVFVGVKNAPQARFPGNPPLTTIAAAPVVREKPFLYVDQSDNYHVSA